MRISFPHDDDTVARLAAYAALPLPPARRAAVGAILAAWIPEAEALSARMRAPALQAVMPATVLVPPPADTGDAT